MSVKNTCLSSPPSWTVLLVSSVFCFNLSAALLDLSTVPDPSTSLAAKDMASNVISLALVVSPSSWKWEQIHLEQPSSLYDKGFKIQGSVSTKSWGLFLESPETFRAHFGSTNSICIFKTKAFGGTKFCSYFNFYSLYNIWKDQLNRISGSEFY